MASPAFIPLSVLTGAMPEPGLPLGHMHLFRVGGRAHLFVPDGSRIYGIDDDWAGRLDQASPGQAAELFEQMGLGSAPFAGPMDAPEQMPVRTLSLAVAQKCNLACSYCYAQQGGFGEEPKSMPAEVALRSVDLLFSEASENDQVTLAFLGGEPLTNRAVLRQATERAVELSTRTGIAVRFSLTTNGTLIREDDGEFFDRYGFSVTVSLDGVGDTHDRLRPFATGRGSYARILENVRPLLAMQRRMQVSARVTVTPGNLRLRETLNEFIGLGFSSVGFSPMLASPAGTGEMDGASLDTMLDQMIECGMECERAILAGRRYPFSNLVTALEQLHRGTHRPYPCGAGGGYFGVSAEGGLFACHRFVNDGAAAFGDVERGVDRAAQRQWLAARHADRQEPCRSCWARYLCGGGCHHEVIHRGRPACGYIKGWLDYCLKAYIRLSALRPDFFGNAPRA
jgi:uncharacterized protein